MCVLTHVDAFSALMTFATLRLVQTTIVVMLAVKIVRAWPRARRRVGSCRRVARTRPSGQDARRARPAPAPWARGLCYFVGELKRQSSYTPTAPRYGIIPRRSAVRVPAPPSSHAAPQAPDARAMRCADVGLPVRRGLSTPQQAAPLLPSVDSPSLHRLQL